MTARDRLRWKAWADSLRQTMMTELTTSVTKSVSQIIAENVDAVDGRVCAEGDCCEKLKEHQDEIDRKWDEKIKRMKGDSDG